MATLVGQDVVTDSTKRNSLLNQPYRHLLLDSRTNLDSGSDPDFTTEDESDIPSHSSHQDHGDNVLGISIGDAQNRMKSAQTPAAEKAQALEDFQSYFPDHAAEAEALVEEPESYDDFVENEDVHTAEATTISNSGSDNSTGSQRHTRSSIVGSIIHGGTNRPRASSGSRVFETLKRVWPDFSGKSSPSAGPVSKTNDPTQTSLDPDNRDQLKEQVSDISVEQPQRTDKLRHTSIGLDGNTESKPSETESRPPLLKRATSDQSLYLLRTATGASQWDSTAPFADRNDQVNSRFKAITDSLQDSSLRLPKMPGVNFGAKRPIARRTTSDETRENTLSNTGRVTSSTLSNNYGDQNHLDNSNDKHHPILKSALQRLTGDIVIMGGYRGSILRDATSRRQVWVPLKVGLNIRKVDLEVGLTSEDEERMEETIIPSGTLSHIGPVDISRRLLRKCRKCHNARSEHLRVHDWGYDWRLSPHLLARKLTKFLESLKCNQPEVSKESRGALVIAHSLGGLITRHVVNQRPDLFKGVIYAGTPQHCVNILGPLRNGDDVLFSSKVLTAQVNFTLRTSYALLPESGRCFVNKDTGERYDIDFFDAKTWEKHRLSPCIKEALSHSMKHQRKSIVGSISETISNYTPSLPGTKRSSWFGNANNNANEDSMSSTTHAKEKIESAKDQVGDAAKKATSPEQGVGKSLEPSMTTGQGPRSSTSATSTIPFDKANEYLDRTLSEIKTFKSELAHQPDLQKKNKYPPHAIIFGKGIPTVYGAKVTSREAIQYSDAYDDLAFAAGDGVVLASAAQLPKGYRCIKGGRIESTRGHVGLLGDLEGIGRCINAVLDARERGVGLGNYV